MPRVSVNPGRRSPGGSLALGCRLVALQAMSIKQLAAEALLLPAQDRARLAGSLWESLADPFKHAASIDDDAAVALARERERQLEAGEVHPVSHEELMSRLRR